MKIKKGFELQVVCGEYLVVAAGEENVNFSKIISLNESAAYLWNNLVDKEAFTIDDMTALLLNEYDVEESIAREDCELIAERCKGQAHLFGDVALPKAGLTDALQQLRGVGHVLVPPSCPGWVADLATV